MLRGRRRPAPAKTHQMSILNFAVPAPPTPSPSYRLSYQTGFVRETDPDEDWDLIEALRRSREDLANLAKGSSDKETPSTANEVSGAVTINKDSVATVEKTVRQPRKRLVQEESDDDDILATPLAERPAKSLLPSPPQPPPPPRSSTDLLTPTTSAVQQRQKPLAASPRLPRPDSAAFFPADRATPVPASPDRCSARRFRMPVTLKNRIHLDDDIDDDDDDDDNDRNVDDGHTAAQSARQPRDPDVWRMPSLGGFERRRQRPQPQLQKRRKPLHWVDSDDEDDRDDDRVDQRKHHDAAVDSDSDAVEVVPLESVPVRTPVSSSVTSFAAAAVAAVGSTAQRTTTPALVPRVDKITCPGCSLWFRVDEAEAHKAICDKMSQSQSQAGSIPPRPLTHSIPLIPRRKPWEDGRDDDEIEPFEIDDDDDDGDDGGYGGEQATGGKDCARGRGRTGSPSRSEGSRTDSSLSPLKDFTNLDQLKKENRLGRMEGYFKQFEPKTSTRRKRSKAMADEGAEEGGEGGVRGGRRSRRRGGFRRGGFRRGGGGRGSRSNTTRRGASAGGAGGSGSGAGGRRGRVRGAATTAGVNDEPWTPTSPAHNYYADDPQFADADMGLGWEGIRGIPLQ